jgi:hypothetical protein
MVLFLTAIVYRSSVLRRVAGNDVKLIFINGVPFISFVSRLSTSLLFAFTYSCIPLVLLVEA